MKLSALINAIEPLEVRPFGAKRIVHRAKSSEEKNNTHLELPDVDLFSVEIDSIYYRAQEVRPGGMFVAIKGQTADGHDYLHQAITNGAAAIVVQKEPPQPYLSKSLARATGVLPVMIRVPDTRKAMADMAAQFFGNPSEKMTLIGITGTNGKTTVAYLIESILLKAGFNVGVIGTINYRYAGKVFDNPMTTPESQDLQRILARMISEGVSHVVMEASSHAMDQKRIRCCWFDVAVFTNLSQDHLDFHGDMESYWASKKSLFTEYLTRGPKQDNAVAVVNCDDDRGRELADALTMPVIKTGAVAGSEIKAENYQCKLFGTAGKVATHEGGFEFKTPLVGIHNVENILNAAGVGVALKLATGTIKDGIEALSAIPGRLEKIESDTGLFVYVDYAHTPDALENAITAIREIAPARVVCVFGCGGDRDKQKRPLMGEIAGRLCDLAVVTSDNPRSEKPLDIIAQIVQGVRQTDCMEYSSRDLTSDFDQKGFVVEPDRRRAITLGIEVSRPNDAVLIAGKGHETYQILGSKTIDFDDRQEARKALQGLNSNKSSRV